MLTRYITSFDLPGMLGSAPSLLRVAVSKLRRLYVVLCRPQLFSATSRHGFNRCVVNLEPGSHSLNLCTIRVLLSYDSGTLTLPAAILNNPRAPPPVPQTPIPPPAPEREHIQTLSCCVERPLNEVTCLQSNTFVTFVIPLFSMAGEDAVHVPFSPCSSFAWTWHEGWEGDGRSCSVSDGTLPHRLRLRLLLLVRERSCRLQQDQLSCIITNSSLSLYLSIYLSLPLRLSLSLSSLAHYLPFVFLSPLLALS